jgi:hypothetical protein
MLVAPFYGSTCFWALTCKELRGIIRLRSKSTRPVKLFVISEAVGRLYSSLVARDHSYVYPSLGEAWNWARSCQLTEDGCRGVFEKIASPPRCLKWVVRCVLGTRSYDQWEKMWNIWMEVIGVFGLFLSWVGSQKYLCVTKDIFRIRFGCYAESYLEVIQIFYNQVSLQKSCCAHNVA